MHDSIEIETCLLLLGVGAEDVFRESLTIHLALSGEDFVTEALPNLVLNGDVSQYVMTGFVGIENENGESVGES